MSKQASVELMFPQDGVDGEVKAFDRNGKEIEVPHRLEVKPIFYTTQSRPNIIYGRVLANGDGQEVNKSIITLSGTTGKLMIQDRSARAVPKFVSTATGAEGEAEEEVEDEDDIEYEEVDEDDDDTEHSA